VGFDGLFGLGFFLGLALTAPVAPLWLDGWFVPGPLVWGPEEDEVVVEGCLEPEPECLEWGVGVELEPVLVVVLGVVAVVDEVLDVVGAVEVVDVVLDCDGHDSEIDLTPGGRLSDETGLPGGSWK
jgi:hypothetical protein